MFLLGFPLSSVITDTVLAFSGKIFCVMLVMMALVSNGVKKSAESFTAQKIKCSIKDFFSKYDQIRSFPRIWSHWLKKSLMENLVFCAVLYEFWRFLSMPFAFLYLNFWEILVFLNILKENLSLSETSDPWTTCLNFIMLGSFFVTIDNISNRLQNMLVFSKFTPKAFGLIPLLFSTIFIN